MKKMVLFVFAVSWVIAANAQQTTATSIPTTPTLKTTPVNPLEDMLVLKEKEFNFGKIPQGKPVVHIFDVANKGSDSLKIVNVVASCGCTTPEWEKDKVVAPGGSTKITVGYNAAAEGPFTKVITVNYNGTQTKQIIISGEVWKTPATSAPENTKLADLKN